MSAVSGSSTALAIRRPMDSEMSETARILTPTPAAVVADTHPENGRIVVSENVTLDVVIQDPALGSILVRLRYAVTSGNA
jgi:hypothetical protein